MGLIRCRENILSILTFLVSPFSYKDGIIVYPIQVFPSCNKYESIKIQKSTAGRPFVCQAWFHTLEPRAHSPSVLSPINSISEPSSYTAQPPCPGFFIQDLFIAQISPPLNYFLTQPSFPLDCEFTGGIKYKFSRSLLSAQGWYPVGAYDMPVAWKDNGVRWDGVLFPSNLNNLRLFPVHVWGTTVPEGPIVPTENTKM